eukprot:1139129-Pelagomonas_calceolata.AAC.1
MQYASKLPPVDNFPSGTNYGCPLRRRGGRGGNREHSAPAAATPPASKVRHSRKVLPKQIHIHLVEAKYCEDIRPRHPLAASMQQPHGLSGCHYLLRASAELQLKLPFIPFC